jgi:membrane associated rhomboid family serine protease
MYLRLAFWTLSLAYTSALFSRTTPGSSPGIMLTAALFGAVFGFSLGALLIDRRTRKRDLRREV